MKATVKALTTYPIKSCAGIAHQSINLNALGLTGDRQLMLVDDEGVFLSQRKHPKMALIVPELQTGLLTVNAPGMQTLHIDLNAFDTHAPVSVWKSELMADVSPQTAATWFSEYLGFPVRLVRYGANSHRVIDQDYAQQDETVAFADGFPVLVTHQSTLEQLNQHLTTPVGMERFRPNIVVTTDLEAWHELSWSKLSKAKLDINLVNPCKRCVMTGVEPSTGEQTGTEVLKTLAQKLPQNGQAIFGMNGIPRINSEPVVLSVGEVLTIT